MTAIALGQWGSFKGTAFASCKKLVLGSKLQGFVAGHDFSRAENAANMSEGFSPCKITRRPKSRSLDFFRSLFSSCNISFRTKINCQSLAAASLAAHKRNKINTGFASCRKPLVGAAVNASCSPSLPSAKG